MGEEMIRGRAKRSGTPRPELGSLTEGAEYLVPASLFDEDVFGRVVDTTKNQKKEKGVN